MRGGCDFREEEGAFQKRAEVNRERVRKNRERRKVLFKRLPEKKKRERELLVEGEVSMDDCERF